MLPFSITLASGARMCSAIPWEARFAQEPVCRHPERVESLVLCATLCGGPLAVYAKPAASAVMRNLDGLTPEQAARRIWPITYAPDYL